MATIVREQGLAERVAVLEEQLAQLRRSGRLIDDLAMFPVYYLGTQYSDSTTLVPAWQNIFTPRSGTLTLGLQLFGDQVGTTNTGGDWQVFLNNVSVASGSVPATYTIVQPVVTLDLTPYLGVKDLLVDLRTRRTSGATTGGRYGTGGCIASTFLYARMS